MRAAAQAVSWLALLLWPVAQLGAQESPQTLAERETIKQQRATIESNFAQAERECSQRFAVTDCVNQLQAQRRQALAALRERELQLDEAKRRAEAEQVQRRLDEKRTAAQQRPAPRPQATPKAREVPASAASTSASRSPPVLPSPASVAATEEAKAAERARRHAQRVEEAAAAASRAEASSRRASEAAAHREKVEQRNAEREASGKNRSAPLPVPAAASATQP